MTTREQRALEVSFRYYIVGLICKGFFILVQIGLFIMSFFHEGINELFRVYFVPAPLALFLLLWGTLLLRLGSDGKTTTITSMLLFLLFFLYLFKLIFGDATVLISIVIFSTYSLTALFLLLKSDR